MLVSLVTCKEMTSSAFLDNARCATDSASISEEEFDLIVFDRAVNYLSI
tara:strand:+ start:392 stop:538 length:147 start_codon:yes stop_codon:yes gene_type:complete